MVNMKIENKIIGKFHSSEIKTISLFHVKNCIIDTVDFDFFECEFKIIIENCIINNLLIHSCWFENGLDFNNNHVRNYVNYQMGGHNKKPINITGNIFCDFVSFFDCHFEDQMLLQNNLFLKGSNLLGNKNEGFVNTFDNEIILIDNIGDLNLDELR